MKLVVFLISFLVLSLSSIPCCLLEEIGEDSLCIESQSKSEGDDPTNDAACSPFFNCGSCTGFAMQENLEIIFHKDELLLAILNSYEDLTKSAYQNSDFKPPKIQII